MPQRTGYVGEGWSADVTGGDGTLTVSLLVVAMGAPVAAVITLPKRSAASALQVLADTLYADSLILGAAVTAHLLTVRPADRQPRQGTPS